MVACGIEKKIVREDNEIVKNENESEDGVVNIPTFQRLSKSSIFSIHEDMLVIVFCKSSIFSEKVSAENERKS